MSEPLLLCRRLDPASAAQIPDATPLRLALDAETRQRLRGHCRSLCGRDLLLQLPRGGGPLQPGELLAGAGAAGELVQVEAAAEPLLRVRSDEPLTLLRAAYHLGNRHGALELAPGELRLLQDPVLEALLRGLGLNPEPIRAPFQPEAGAYGGHSHGHGHNHSHSHENSQHHQHAPDSGDGR
ncbi:MAG: urease accessory protein UreE [Cyanobium sp.]